MKHENKNTDENYDNGNDICGEHAVQLEMKKRVLNSENLIVIEQSFRCQAPTLNIAASGIEWLVNLQLKLDVEQSKTQRDVKIDSLHIN